MMTHGDVGPCCADDDGQCCSSFYQNDVVRQLLGDSFHPGGVDFTLAISEGLELGPDVSVLDVACGEGSSLRALQGRWGVTAVGLDAGGDPKSNGIEIRRGDAHDVPFDDESFDAVLCECALSTFRDKPTALSEMARVLRPGGRLALTDMVVEGPLPEGLSTWGHIGTCIPGALSLAEYEALIIASGLRVIESRDAPEALRELSRRIKRNLVGVILAQAAGSFSGPEVDKKLARDLLRQAESAVDTGALGYGVILAERSP